MLQYYQMQLMALEKRNKNRLLMQRAEQLLLQQTAPVVGEPMTQWEVIK
jgi:hypothetical protein